MPRISRRSAWPLYLQIADDLREQILDQKLAPGERVPSEHTLMETYDASRQTVRKALAELKSEGLLDAEQGRGVFVRSRAPIIRSATQVLSRRQWMSTDHPEAPEGTKVEVKVGQVPATPEIATRLGVREGTPLLVRRERTFDDTQTLGTVTSYLPLELGRGTPLEREEISGGGTYRCLEEAGRRLERFAERVSTRMPRPAEAKALDLGPGTPVLLIERTAWTVQGQPVVTSDELLAADREELLYEVPAGDRMRLVRSVDDLQAAMITVAREARECLVAVGSRSRDAGYLDAIEQVLKERPRLVHYRILVGPPHHLVFKNHLFRLLELRDPASREHGIQTLFMGMVEDLVREPERFFVANERSAVITLPSLNTAGYFDTGIVVDHPQEAQGLLQHAKALYYGTTRLEDARAVQALPVLR
ncbi:MAG TPA: GntR family transcriptional regulator [Actinomycetes bacterium]|nr:GntR family transcriptional regulator [Actinomycetes bacterium]